MIDLSSELYRFIVIFIDKTGMWFILNEHNAAQETFKGQHVLSAIKLLTINCTTLFINSSF